MKKKEGNNKPGLERQHETMLRKWEPIFVLPENESLEQPTPYRVVQTVTTYSAYEEPI